MCTKSRYSAIYREKQSNEWAIGEIHESGRDPMVLSKCEQFQDVWSWPFVCPDIPTNCRCGAITEEVSPLPSERLVESWDWQANSVGKLRKLPDGGPLPVHLITA